jgi:hypothetical protein
MTLMLHAGAEPIDFAALRDLPVPVATPTHVPIPHFRLVEMLVHTLSFYGHVVTEQHHGATPDGMRYFGVLALKSPYTGYEDMVALRNSHDKSLPVGIGFGGKVFCCDNLSLIADHVIRRKHTANAKRDLPGLIGELIEPLALQREAQHRTFERYRGTLLTDQQADHAVLNMFRQGILNVQRIPEVLREYEEPSFDEFKDERSAWRLFNAATFALTGRVIENAAVTPRLHAVIDGACERIN